VRGRVAAAIAALVVLPAGLGIPMRPGDSRRVDATAVGPRGMVVSVDGIASRVGARVLERGGNAVDAAVAVAFTLAVTYPRAGNLGGGGFLMVRMADGRAAMIDYRETAPASAGPDAYLGADGVLDEDAAALGYRAAGVPATVHGLARAHREYGTLPWHDLVEPARAVAEAGFRVDRDTAESLARAADSLARFPSSREIFLGPDGSPPRIGDLIVQTDLARTLAEVARDGTRAMTHGETGRRIAAAMAHHGGWVTLDDLRRYEAVIRAPVRIRYRQRWEILAPNLPSSGGITLARMLAFLESFPVSDHPPHSAETVHLLAEAMRRGFRDRAEHLGDADFVDVPVDRLLSGEHVPEWIEGFRPDRATPSLSLAGSIPVVTREGRETTHFSVIDEEGNVVSNTYTINYSYGSKAVADGTGILLNNEMDDFNLSKRTDDRGRIGTPANRIEPGKRMLSSMTPLIVLRDGRPVLILGSPGGRTIISTVLRIVVNVIDFGMSCREAVDAPRFHHGWLPDELELEDGGFSPRTVRDLRARGHALRFVEFQGDAHCIEVDPRTGIRTGVADRRIDGAAVAASRR
jgi:gamma-glutamyltranspeptidase/glutathione hydrolase